MDVVNPFILKNKIGMVKFVDELCNVELDLGMIDEPMDINNNDPDIPELSQTEKETVDLAHDLATIHNICENHRQELDQLAGSSQNAKRLLTILTILSQHKQYYSNLRKGTQNSLNATSV